MGRQSRLWEIDCARGIAILMMIVFHTVFDLSFFAIFPVDVATGFWRYFAYATATLFLLIVGVSLVISHDRAAVKLSGFSLTKKFILRGAGIFALGLLVTLATWFYLPQGYVIFGILHLIGVSVMLSPLFLRLKAWNIPAGILCILIGWFVTSRISLPSPPLFLLPLGIHTPSFWSVDYTPLFPWLGVVLIGMGAGAFLYAGGTRHFALKPLPEYFVRPLSFLGRHSLVIYLVHQPVIILLLAAVTGTKVL
ncbi:heparan-alpha-glucosaminide N-acetyltransferase [Methanoregula sp.]|uniref:heparan-alpha-glucosaminide N-acetyltransferase n=1 Tax=Methanoregula sp. TaxID=2052170 RepID=UPI00261ED1E2|nr:heparan-alpha-glucosaminide N-acetyltransferase [Methanoregula sp.]MDD5143926.1 heparan-alpha-glucosaminide N-acetyltransferase [Methanoregula sp.]